jgi:hypothetical protein
MNIFFRSGSIAGTMLLVVVAISSPRALAQIGQQQMNDAARRMQQNDPNEERLRMNDNERRMQQNDSYGQQNAPVQGLGPPPSYQRAPAQMAPRRPGTQVDATAATAGAEWVPASGYQEPAVAVYAARSTIHRSGNSVQMWDMYDFKTARVFQGRQYLSLKNQMDYDCKGARGRLLSTTAFSGHMGKGNVVISDANASTPWEPVRPGSGTTAEALAKIACAGK